MTPEDTGFSTAERSCVLPKLDPHETHFLIPSPLPGLRLFLRHLPPTRSAGATPKVVLYVHGGTFASALSIAHRFDGHSWRDALCAAGFDVWGLDFHGFGASDPYPEMAEPAERHTPLGRAAAASRQLEQAVRFIAAHHKVPAISLVAHSWGTMVAGDFAGRCPALVDRLVFFGPIAQRPKRAEPQRLPGWRLISLKDQWGRFVADTPQGEPAVLERRHFDDWGEAYLDSDAPSRTRTPAAVKAPSGAFQDIFDAWAGTFAYDPGLVRAPVAIIRGEWDSMANDDDARWLFDSLKASPARIDVKIARASHLMLLEENRFALYREAESFLKGEVRPAAQTAAAATKVAAPEIPGYDYGTARAARSPLTLDELRALEQSVGWTAQDDAALKRAGAVLGDQAEALVDSWRARIGQQPHLAKWFFGPDGKPDESYKAAVKKRFVQWVTDACLRPRDQAWLDYQEEIALRHTPAKKNQTDGVHTPEFVPLRYLLSFMGPAILGAQPFLANKGDGADMVAAMQQAWTKTVLLHITLWSRPYARDGLW